MSVCDGSRIDIAADKLPFDQIKIDQSFVRDIVSDGNDRVIVRTIIAMAESLNMSVIAEGVETEEQRKILMSKGCAYYQGFLFGKPLPIALFEALLFDSSGVNALGDHKR